MKVQNEIKIIENKEINQLNTEIFNKFIEEIIEQQRLINRLLLLLSFFKKPPAQQRVVKKPLIQQPGAKP